ncbi:MAG: ArsR/SmtB family transcription factor [Arenicella sp.]
MSNVNVLPANTYDLLKTSPQSLLSKDADIEHTSNCLKAMAHPLRLKILCLLSKFDHISVLDLVEAVGTSQSNISQHLSILKEKGLLKCEKDANKVYYTLADADLSDLINSVRKAFCNKSLNFF